MDYRIRPARRSEAKPLIGLYSESGCGKTYGALLLAKGFTGDMATVGMIETESGRGEVFADDAIIGGYQVISMRDDFSPKNYGQAIDLANHSNLKALIIDSASHEWEGSGGVLGMAAANQAAGKKGPLVWQQPKMDHQREFMLRLMQTPIPLVIVCMRAKYPMKETTTNGKKEWTRSTELDPKQSEDILFEMMVHAWIDKNHFLHPTKYTKDELKQVFVEGKMITIDTGKKLFDWSKGVVKTTAEPPTPPLTEVPAGPQPPLRTTGVNEMAHVASQSEQSNALPDDVILAKIDKVDSKEGTTNGKPWKVYFVITATGGKYATFDEKIADLANTYMNTGELITLKWEYADKAKTKKQILELAA